MSSSKRWKTTRNSDLEAMGKENVRFYLPIIEFLPGGVGIEEVLWALGSS